MNHLCVEIRGGRWLMKYTKVQLVVFGCIYIREGGKLELTLLVIRFFRSLPQRKESICFPVHAEHSG